MLDHNNPNEVQTLEAVSAAWEQAMVSNDADAIGQFMADDWVIVSERGATKKSGLSCRGRLRRFDARNS